MLVTMPKKKVVLILLHLNFETIYFYAILRRNEGKKLSKRVSFVGKYEIERTNKRVRFGDCGKEKNELCQPNDKKYSTYADVLKNIIRTRK